MNFGENRPIGVQKCFQALGFDMVVKYIKVV